MVCLKISLLLDEVGKLGWTLGERQFTEVDGKKMKLSDIEKKINPYLPERCSE